jgi:hypothetical protein
MFSGYFLQGVSNYLRARKKIPVFPLKCSKNIQDIISLNYKITNYVLKKMFPLTLPTLINCAYPKGFLGIFEQALIKVRMCPLRKLAFF